jgi:hypothetical protein
MPGISGGSGGGSSGGTFGAVSGSGNTPPTSPPQGNPGSPCTSTGPGSGGGGGGGAAAAAPNKLPPAPILNAAPGGAGAPIATTVFGPTAPSYGTPGPAPGRYFAGGGGGGAPCISPNLGGTGGAGGGGNGGSIITPGAGGTMEQQIQVVVQVGELVFLIQLQGIKWNWWIRYSCNKIQIPIKIMDLQLTKTKI